MSLLRGNLHGNLRAALGAWRKVLGEEHVVTDGDTLSSTESATFLTTQRIAAAIYPGSREEVQACVRVANEHRVPIYPVSTGKNWAYGSRVPPSDGCVLMGLHRLDRITDYDEELAYVTVEPGVTFRQLHEFLHARGSRLMVSATGGPPDSSLIGNALERGAGSGRYRDRFVHACALEVVLATGETLGTGFARYASAKTAELHRSGVGPDLNGLLAQGNLGIVTKMTVWLEPAPKYFQTCFFGIEEDGRLGDLIDTLRNLQLDGALPAGATVRNTLNVMSRMQQYPWEALEGRTPMPEGFLETLRKGFWRSAWWSSLWIGWADLPAGSREEGLAGRDIIETALKDKVDRLAFLDDEGVEIRRWEKGADREAVARYFGSEDPEEASSSYVPSEDNIFSTYWRKKSPAPESGLDPDRDRCGVMFCVPTVPYDGRHVRKAVEIARENLAKYGFEPILIVGCFTERVVYLDAAIHFDREVPGEDEKALACHDSLLGRMIEEGYIPYRLGLQSVKLLPEPKNDYGEVLGRIKKALDPNGILAPGRYGIW